jgi:hypothetical protein
MNTQRIFFLMVLLGSLCFQSCVKDKCQREVTYTKATPIYRTYDEIRIPIQMEGVRDLKNTGKIYAYQNYIFINELKEGVHLFDNSDPANPIPGNVDIAIRNNIMFADNYTDLLTIDLSDVTNPVLAGRIENAFESYGNTAEGVLVDYLYEQVTEVVDCNNNIWFEDVFVGGGPELDNSSGSDDKGVDGTGGSLARFSLYDQYLYVIDQFNLHSYNIANLTNPAKVGETQIGWGIETLYAFGDKLFIGSQAGMFIYDASNPASPQYLSGYSHWTACDPVFVKDNYAYVTLRDGVLCNGSELNQLDLIDITDILNPVLVKTFPMDNPHGLSIKDNNLFLCEGDSGLKVFDIEDPLTLDQRLLSKLTSLSAVDVIVLPQFENVLLVIGTDGFYQVNFANPEELEVLSFVKTK